ncbi:MAG: hypothetical protein KME35_14970 [Aphanocapsa sp. GSE-SYN-MK-11-07L]|jgi:hypothetical protein|nr:hypothetical protein [Aphanocapsa sp. GSE-SYN-MK-11-07L]
MPRQQNSQPKANGSILLSPPAMTQFSRKPILSPKQLFYSCLVLGGAGLTIAAPHFSTWFTQLTDIRPLAKVFVLRRK